MNRFYLTPDRKKGYTVAFSGQGGNRRTEFWVFDVTARKVIKKLEFESRARLNFAVSSDGRKLDIYGAGPTIEIYDADTLTLEKTITLDGDAITQLLVLRPRTRAKWWAGGLRDAAFPKGLRPNRKRRREPCRDSNPIISQPCAF
jgi:hypothetical protein